MKEQTTISLPRPKTDVLKSACVILVVIGHVGVKCGYTNPFAFLGCLPVGFFLLMSGYGMMSRLDEDPGYLKSIPRRRLPGVLIPFIAANCIYFAIKYSLGVLQGVTLIDMLFGGRNIVTYSWYIIAILYFYLSFYLSFRFFPRRPLLALFAATLLWIAVMLGSGGGMHRYVSAVCFLLGAWLYRRRERVFLLLEQKKVLAALICATAVFFALSAYGWSRWGSSHVEGPLVMVTTVLFAITLVSMTLCCGLKCRPLERLSALSLELYLYHGLFILLYRCQWLTIGSDILYAVLVLATSILAAVVMNKLNRFLLRRMGCR